VTTPITTVAMPPITTMVMAPAMGITTRGRIQALAGANAIIMIAVTVVRAIIVGAGTVVGAAVAGDTVVVITGIDRGRTETRLGVRLR
jgi:hypothetical protein